MIATTLRTLAVGLAAAAALAAPTVAAQTGNFPAKPIRLIVTAAPGGITDIMARLMSEQFQKTLGQPMIVENRPGGGGNVGTEFVARSAPDGYTLLIVNVGNIAVHKWIYDNLAFDPINDLVPVAPVADGVTILAVNAKVPGRTLREFIDHAKGNTRRLNYGSAGNGTMPHLAAEAFGYLTGTEFVHIPYKGAAPAAVDLATGQIELAFIAFGSMRAQLAAGQIRALAVVANKRLAVLPDVPTFEEAGLAAFDATNWFGVFAPRGASRELVSLLNATISRMFDDPAVVKRFHDAGTLPMRESPEAFQKRVLADDAKWREVVKRAGIKAQ